MLIVIAMIANNKNENRQPKRT